MASEVRATEVGLEHFRLTLRLQHFRLTGTIGDWIEGEYFF